MGRRDEQAIVTWWLDKALLAQIKDFQHAERLDSLVEAARLLLARGLAASPPR